MKINLGSARLVKQTTKPDANGGKVTNLQFNVKLERHEAGQLHDLPDVDVTLEIVTEVEHESFLDQPNTSPFAE